MNGIRHTKTSPYNPSTNGLAERYVREFKNLLRKNNGKDDLETNLQSFLFAHRASPQTVIKEFPGGTANEEKFKIKILEFNTKMRNPREVFHEAVRRDGNRWVIVCTDYLTKYAITKALPTGGAVEIAKFILNYIILKHGAPREMITDRGRSFQSKLVNELTKMCGMSQLFTTAYYPQTNGLTERLNKTLEDILSMYVDVEQKNWDSILPSVTFAYNTAKQETTGFTPFYLVHGREAETMLDTLLPYQPDYENVEYLIQLIIDAEDARQLARLHLVSTQDIDKRRYDSIHRPVYNNVGHLVLIFTPVRKVGLSEKLLKKYFGPYKITKKISDVNYEVITVDESSRRKRSKDVVHVLRVKPYKDPGQQDNVV
ncbi:hypothetical protein LAZ67_2003665 [Cordylochernes scorpioides]|uniref:Integrase catalytic domain-containing protein n=1 Tax=Cordylochernes scorpioides TaxID=51811 RepID=A0ABY6K3C0_9ARAC|nr:hypothetical protein LAZ67_2003665 [Cordylochernes scorpioides]